jgi:non-specific protein-tyrosine kinase
VAALIGAPGEPHIQPTAVEGLSVLAAGTDGEHATDALSSERMQRVVADLAQRADVVLFLAPAVTVYSDAAVLASRVDGALLVVNAGKTRRDSAEKAKAILTRAHARLIGAVMLGGR